jgi:choline kinase
MKVIILAAGQGTRLRPLTNDLPKCMVALQGKPLLDHQLEVLAARGITDRHIVAGYLSDRIERPELQKHINPAYACTNMVRTLFCAADLMNGDEDILITYGDVVYTEQVLVTLMSCDAPICLGVDLNWREYWQARMEDPLQDAETLRLNDGNRIIELGKKPISYDQIEGQYMGLIKIRADHVLKFKAFWENMDRTATYDGKDFDNMFMTSFLQSLIDAGWDVRAAFTRNGWMEVDAPEDLAFDASPFWRPHSA